MVVSSDAGRRPGLAAQGRRDHSDRNDVVEAYNNAVERLNDVEFKG